MGAKVMQQVEATRTLPHVGFPRKSWMVLFTVRMFLGHSRSRMTERHAYTCVPILEASGSVLQIEQLLDRSSIYKA